MNQKCIVIACCALLISTQANALDKSRALDCLAEFSAGSITIKAFRDGGADIPYQVVKSMNSSLVDITKIVMQSGFLKDSDISEDGMGATLNTKIEAIQRIAQASGTHAAMKLIISRIEECASDFGDLWPHKK